MRVCICRCKWQVMCEHQLLPAVPFCCGSWHASQNRHVKEEACYRTGISPSDQEGCLLSGLTMAVWLHASRCQSLFVHMSTHVPDTVRVLLARCAWQCARCLLDTAATKPLLLMLLVLCRVRPPPWSLWPSGCSGGPELPHCAWLCWCRSWHAGDFCRQAGPAWSPGST